MPAGTPEALCRGCDTLVFWIDLPSGKRMPVDCGVDEDGCHDPSPPGAIRPYDGYGVSHFATCPDAARFRRPR